jgi:hypothetical protein
MEFYAFVKSFYFHVMKTGSERPVTTGCTQAEAEMHRNNGNHVIEWHRLAGATRAQKESAVATVHPIKLNGFQPCLGVTLDRRWLCGSDGALCFFDSMATAIRFMSLLNVDHLDMGGRCDCNSIRQGSFQCFQIGTEGITTCNKCRFGEVAISRSNRESARSEERW